MWDMKAAGSNRIKDSGDDADEDEMEHGTQDGITGFRE